MMSIWKYDIPLDHYSVAMPRGAVVLTAQMQHGNVCIWAEVETDAPKESRRFWVIGTGHERPSNVRYVNSVQDGQFVWHVYEVPA